MAIKQKYTREDNKHLNTLVMRWRGKCHKCNLLPSVYLIGQICKGCQGKREAAREYGTSLRINLLSPPYIHTPPKGALELTGAGSD